MKVDTRQQLFSIHGWISWFWSQNRGFISHGCQGCLVTDPTVLQCCTTAVRAWLVGGENIVLRSSLDCNNYDYGHCLLIVVVFLDPFQLQGAV